MTIDSFIIFRMHKILKDLVWSCLSNVITSTVCLLTPFQICCFLSPDIFKHFFTSTILPQCTQDTLKTSYKNQIKGPSIYDVHKKITFLTPSPCPHGPDHPLWTSTHGRHEIHTALLKWLVQ